MLGVMKKLIITVAIFAFSSYSLAENIEKLHSVEWSVPKKATTLLEMPAIKKSMQTLLSEPNSFLKLKYPGGDEGTLWVNELRSWLVALGLSSTRIELVPGSAISTTIELEVVSNTK